MNTVAARDFVPSAQFVRPSQDEIETYFAGRIE